MKNTCNLIVCCKKIVLSFVAVGGILFASCSSGEGGALPTYAIERMAYEDVLVLDGHTESVNSVNINCPPEVDGTIINIVESGTLVKEGDVVCEIEDVGIENSYENLLIELESAFAELEKLKASQQLEFALLEAQVKNNDAETLLAGFDSIQMLYMSPVERRTKELQLERASIERAHLLKKLDATKLMQEVDVMRIEKRISRLERRLETEKQRMESLQLRAPKGGIAVRARRRAWREDTWTIGDNIWDGRTVVTIPDLDSIKVVIYVQETDFKRLQMGDSVAYTFDAMPNNRAWGRITKMASVGMARTEGSQVKTFEVETSIDSLMFPVEPGLSARCQIFIQHIPDTIVVPTISIYDEDSSKVVYVQKGRKYEKREVTLGIGSPKMTIVDKGLNEGEQIALIKPKENQ